MVEEQYTYCKVSYPIQQCSIVLSLSLYIHAGEDTKKRLLTPHLGIICGESSRLNIYSKKLTHTHTHAHRRFPFPSAFRVTLLPRPVRGWTHGGGLPHEGGQIYF